MSRVKTSQDIYITDNSNLVNTEILFNNHCVFVNNCLKLMYGKLPSYAYYDDINDTYHFYENLANEEKYIIYNYLVHNKFINPYVITAQYFCINFRKIIDDMINE